MNVGFTKKDVKEEDGSNRNHDNEQSNDPTKYTFY